NAEVKQGPQPPELMPLELHRTGLKSLDSFDLNRERLAKLPNGHEVVQAALDLLREAEARKVKPAEVNTWADRAAKSAELYGPRYLGQVLRGVARALADEKG